MNVVRRAMSLCGAALALAWSLHSHAALIGTDLIAGSGDKRLTIDTRSHLEWLDVSHTAGRSMNDVLADFGGFISAGFRYASGTELRDLFDSAGVTEGTTHDAAAILNLQVLLNSLGSTYENNPPSAGNPFGQQSLYGIYGDAYSSRSDKQAFSYAAFSASDNLAVVTLANQIYPESRDSLIGSFLVRASAPTAVPEPSSSALLGIGIVLLALRLPRRTSGTKHLD
jgi:hypothetical protein